MAAGRGRHWDWLAAAAGLLFGIGAFLYWWRSNDDNWRGISYLGMEGWVILLAALMAMAVPFVARMRQTAGRIQQYRMTVALVTLLALAETIFRMADPPEFDSFSDVPVTLKPGAWISLIAAVAILLFLAAGMRATLARRPARSATA
jgi:hypothetical protein